MPGGEALKIHTVTFLRLRFVESFFWHKCCDTKIANLLVNMQGNLLLFSGTGGSLPLKNRLDQPGQCHTAGMPASRTGGSAVRILHAVGVIPEMFFLINNRVPLQKNNVLINFVFLRLCVGNLSSV